MGNTIDTFLPGQKAGTCAIRSASIEAATYDSWFRSQIEKGVKEANDPSAHWVSNADVKKHFAAKRHELRERLGDAA